MASVNLVLVLVLVLGRGVEKYSRGREGCLMDILLGILLGPLPGRAQNQMAGTWKISQNAAGRS